MADSERHRLETIARHEARRLRETCSHELTQYRADLGRSECKRCGFLLPYQGFNKAVFLKGRAGSYWTRL